jgi:hypothetical protein
LVNVAARIAAAAAAVTIAACGGTETGNPFTVESRLHAHSSEPGRVGVVAAATEARVDGVWLSTGGHRLIADDCTTTAATTPIPDAGANHAGPVTTVSFELDGDPLCAIAIPLVVAAAAPPGAPPELAGHSVLVTGTRLADAVPFRIRLALATDIVLMNVAGPFAFSEDDFGMFLGFDVASWIDADVDLAGATPVAGTIGIDAANDPARTAAFTANFPAGLELYTDHDRDGSAAGETQLADGAP